MRTPTRRDLARRIVIGVLVVWGAGSLMVASDLVDSRDGSFVVAWLAVFGVGLALLYALFRFVVRR
jgi:hypothetical protein